MSNSSFFSNSYQLTGINNYILNNLSFAIGKENIAGGYKIDVVAFDKETRTLTTCDCENGKIGDKIFLYTDKFDDNSPYSCKVASVEDDKIVLASDLDIGDEFITEKLSWIASVPDVNNFDSNLAFGEYNFSVGNCSMAIGSCNLASGTGSMCLGVCNEATENMAIAGGTLCKAQGVASLTIGCENIASGKYSVSLGASCKAIGDNSFAVNSMCEANGGNSFASGFSSKANGMLSTAMGALAEANGDYSFALGYQVKTSAKQSMIIGLHGNIDDSFENRGAFAIAGGEKQKEQLSLIFRPYKKIDNPLYGQANEDQYLLQIDPCITYKGHLLPETIESTSSALSLDHAKAARWKITPTSNVSPTLKNWRDGDSGELIVYNGGSKILFPSSWKWTNERSSMKNIDVFKIRQIDDTIIITHEVNV